MAFAVMPIGMPCINRPTTRGTALTTIGNGAFPKTAGELRYRYDGTGDTLVEADINGDGIADLVIRMTGEHALTAGDFVL